MDPRTNRGFSIPFLRPISAHPNRTFRQRRFGKKIRDVSANFSCRNVPYYLGFVFGFPLEAAYIPILLNEVEQEQRPSGKGDREAIVVGAGLCDGEGERAYTGSAPHIIRHVSANVFSLRRFGIFFLPKSPPPCFCRNVRNSQRQTFRRQYGGGQSATTLSPEPLCRRNSL